jgi:hypothetical protein
VSGESYPAAEGGDAVPLRCGQCWVNDERGTPHWLDAYADGWCFMIDQRGHEHTVSEDTLRRDYSLRTT